METTEIQYEKVHQSGVQTSYNNEIGQFLRDHKAAIPPRNKYVVPITKYIKPYVTTICKNLGLNPEIYKGSVYFSIKEYLKKSKDNIVHIPSIGTVFLHQTNPNTRYHGDRRLRPDICLDVLQDLLKFLHEESIRFFETYYCDKEVLAIEYINPCISLRKEISTSYDSKNLESYYEKINSQIIAYFDRIYPSLGGPYYRYNDDLILILDTSLDNILFEGYDDKGIPRLILMDIFYLKEV